VLHKIKHDGGVQSVAFSPDGELLATASYDDNARIIKTATGVVLHKIEHGDSVRSVAFSPDSELLATGSSDNNARIIKTVTGAVLHKIKHDGFVFSVAFSPDNEWLATGSEDTNARIYACLTNNLKNAVLIAYLRSCQDSKHQPNMRGWLLEAFRAYRHQNALKMYKD
jgi:WD40 repeat protein